MGLAPNIVWLARFSMGRLHGGYFTCLRERKHGSRYPASCRPPKLSQSESRPVHRAEQGQCAGAVRDERKGQRVRRRRRTRRTRSDKRPAAGDRSSVCATGCLRALRPEGSVDLTPRGTERVGRAIPADLPEQRKRHNSCNSSKPKMPLPQDFFIRAGIGTYANFGSARRPFFCAHSCNTAPRGRRIWEKVCRELLKGRSQLTAGSSQQPATGNERL
jgi:hypothetical protein